MDMNPHRHVLGSDYRPLLNMVYQRYRSQLTTINNGGLGAGLKGTGIAAKSLDLLHNIIGLVIGDFAKDDVLAVKP